MTEPAGEWLTRVELSGVWQRIRDRLERSGGLAAGRVTISVASREERHAVGDLLGVPVVTDRVRIDLADLERRLVARGGYASLARAVEVVTGSPLRDRPQERTARSERRRAPVELARSLVDWPWLEEWLTWLSGSGVLARAPDGEVLVRDAAAVLREVLEGRQGSGSRVELAASLLGDAHALDEDTLLHAAVLRGLAAASGVESPTGVVGRRALWAQHGIRPDLLSSTCLVVGLRVGENGALAQRLAVAAGAGDPVHLTPWDLRRRIGTAVQAGAVLVCENPRVLEAVAERFGGDVPAVCTSGQPNTVVTEVLAWLREAGCELRYHGDFDWPGIAIANRLVAQCGVSPWLMDAESYEAGLRSSGPKLLGSPTEPCWDAELGAVMRSRGLAVHEESVLDQLLDALGGSAATTGSR